MTEPPSRAVAADSTHLDAGDGIDEYDEYQDEQNDEFEDDEPEERPRGWPWGAMLATAIGVWAGRAFYRLPDRLEDLTAFALTALTALFAVGIYRRWVRKQLAQARARRQPR
ncbi:MAG: hypothetical protein EXR66_05500 [Dehalococcoidia bacterium]|nr:hypothetical protein [Dehalococcoidia bacterium]